MNRRSILRAGDVVLAILLACTSAAPMAGEFSINPLRVMLDRTTRSSEGVVNVLADQLHVLPLVGVARSRDFR